MIGRLHLLTAGVLLVWGALAVRLSYLQLYQHQRLREHARSQQKFDEVIPARWGDIVDRSGRLLATTARCRSLFVDPSCVRQPECVAAQLADLLQLDADRLADKIARHNERKFLWVQRHLTDDEVERVIGLDLPENVWGLREEFRRVYPHGSLAAHLLGWRNIDGVAQAGLERSLNKSLQGTDGRRTLVRDARGFVIEILQEVTESPRHGGTVMLTLDVRIQRSAEAELEAVMAGWRPRSACAIVIDPHTGEILAMASRPTYDPSRPSAALRESWTNHAIASAYEPGSTIKPCIAAWAVDRGSVSPEDTFLCNGAYRMGRRLLHDHRAFGRLDVAGIISHSSNIGMSQIGEAMGNARLHSALHNFGFGRKTGIELPGESAGIVRPLEQWDHYSTGSVPMGQETAATPLQMIAAHAALANGGLLITPHLVFRDEAHGGRPQDVLAARILHEPTARWMTNGPMVDVVRRGTAPKAAIEGVTVFAKTGTAQKFDRELGAYADNRYVSSCLCGAPAEAPRAIVLVTVDEPAAEGNPSGGSVAAPAAAAILRRTLESLDSASPPDTLLRVMVQQLGSPQNRTTPPHR